MLQVLEWHLKYSLMWWILKLNGEDFHVQDMDYSIRISNDLKLLAGCPIKDFQMHFTKLLPYHHHLLFLPCVLAHLHNLFLISLEDHHRWVVLSHILRFFVANMLRDCSCHPLIFHCLFTLLQIEPKHYRRSYSYLRLV